jgi:anaphase-promoting complex subunit 8
MQTKSDYVRAEAQFEHVLAKDPQRIDDIDVLSNILYVTENRLKLSRLAHEFLELEKDRPEICCLVGECRLGLVLTSGRLIIMK